MRSELAHSDLHGVYSLDYRTTHLATSIPASPTPSARAFASLPSPPPSTSTSSQSLSTAYPDASASTTSRHSRRSKHRQRSESSTLQGSSVYAQEDLPGVWPIEGWRQLSGYVFAASIGIGVRLVSLFSSTWRAGKHWAGGLVTDGRLARRLSLERSSRPSSWAFAGANTCMLVAQELSPSVANPPARVSRGCDLDLFSPVLLSFSSRSFRTSPSPSFVSVWCSPLFSSPCPFGVVVSPPRSAVSVAPFVPPRLDRRPVFRLRLCRQLQCVHIHSVRLSQLGAAACDEGCGGSGGSSGASRGGEGLIGSPSTFVPLSPSHWHLGGPSCAPCTHRHSRNTGRHVRTLVVARSRIRTRFLVPLRSTPRRPRRPRRIRSAGPRSLQSHEGLLWQLVPRRLVLLRCARPLSRFPIVWPPRRRVDESSTNIC